jgi:hypothetical protein
VFGLGKMTLLGRMEGDVHANSNQEGSADKAHVGNGLENTAKSLPLKDQKITYNLECDQSLRTVASQGTGNEYEKRTRRWDAPRGCRNCRGGPGVVFHKNGSEQWTK